MIGERVKYSAAYLRSATPRNKQRIGTIVGEGYGGTCWNVVWDGNKPRSRSAIHKDLLDTVPAKAAATS